MNMEYEVQRCSRKCTVTGRELLPGETCYSALIEERNELKRLDFAAEAWTGPPEGALGWWKAQIATPEAKRTQAPNEVMLEFFDQLADRPDRSEMRYLLALLLVRRRVFRLEDGEDEKERKDGEEMLTVYCPRRDTTYRVPVRIPDVSRAASLQDELARVLFERV